MDKTKALQKLLDGSASEEEIQLLKQGLASGEISIGGNVNHSVIIIGSGNTLELPPAALDRLNARPLLGDLDRDLTGAEIALGLERLESELPLRAPVMLISFNQQTRRLRPSLKTSSTSLSESARKERIEALALINSLCIETLDISFNALCLGEEPPEYDSRSPFRGLESFRPEDSEFFFGREALTKKLVGKINAHSFLAVLGASGSGKSSLVMAGLIPALGSDAKRVILRPGTDPLAALESAQGKSLIVVDQFEELFTLTRSEAARKEFIKEIFDLSKTNRVIITMRADFWGEIAVYKDLKQAMQDHQELIAPMDTDELRRAMEAQANQAGLRFEADLSQQILDDVKGEPGAMPLLQHALWELWNRRHGRNLRASEYRAFGGVKQAIASTAEKVYGECTKAEQEQMRDIFLRLTRLDDRDEGRDTRRRVTISGLIPSGRDTASITLLLDKLANARLIVKTVNEDKTEIEVAHEALIRHWERLRAWLNEDRDNLRLRESVSEDAREWENSKRNESLLNHRGGRLDDALSLGDNSRYGLTAIEQSYLNACVALRNKEQRERERRLQWTVTASIAAAIIFLVLGSFGLVKSNEAAAQAAVAQANANIAIARQLTVQAQSLFANGNSKQIPAVLLAIQSMRMFPTSAAAQVLQDNTLAHSIARMTYDGPVYSAVFSPDGRYVISGGCDQPESNNNCAQGSARVWEAATGKEISRMTHNSYVDSVAFSPDGSYVVSGSWDNTARVWEAATGKEIARVTHGSFVYSVAFSPDGRYVVSGGCDQLESGNNCAQGSARVWEAATGKEIARITQDDGIRSAAFSPDGNFVLSTGCDQRDSNGSCIQGSARVWEAATGKEISRMTQGIWVYSAAFSPNGKYVVSGSRDHTVRVWEAATGKEITRMAHDGFVYSVAFSPDGKYVVSGGCEQALFTDTCTQGAARVWDVATGKEVARMTYDDRVYSVAFSPDGKYVISGSDDSTARVWEASTGKEIARMTHDSLVNSVAFSPDGKYAVSGSDDNTARVWEAAIGKEITRMSQDSDVNSVAFSSDGKYVVASGGNDVTARVWEASTGKEIARMTHDSWVNSVAFSPDGKYVVSKSDYDRTARVWEASTGKEIACITDDDYYVTSVAFSPDSKYVVSVGDTTARVWEAGTGKEIARMTHDGQAYSAAFSPDGKYVISGGCDQLDAVGYCTQGSARVWEANTGKKIAGMTHDSNVYFVAFSPDGKYVISAECAGLNANDAANNDCPQGSSRVWEAVTGKEISHMTYDDTISSVAFSPDGRYVISVGDMTVRVWEASTGKEVAHMTHDYQVSSVAFSPDSTYVVSVGDNTARVWDAAKGKEISRMRYDDYSTSAAFSPDGRYVVSGGDNTARVWEALTGQEVAHMMYDNNVTSVAFSPDGKYVVSGGCDQLDSNNQCIQGSARVWMYRPDDLIVEACSRVTRSLTLAEWKQYIGDAMPYQAVCPDLPLDLEYIKAIAAEALLNSNDPSRVKTALDKVNAEMIKDKTIKDPNAEALSVVSAAAMEQISVEAAIEDIEKALDLFEQAKQMQVQISFDDTKTLNALCWFGSLQGYAEQALQHCESAVKLAPDDADVRDSRGLARALTGDFEGAILDFQYYADNSANSDMIEQRKQWIEELEKGINPFTTKVLESLKSQ